MKAAYYLNMQQYFLFFIPTEVISWVVSFAGDLKNV